MSRLRICEFASARRPNRAELEVGRPLRERPPTRQLEKSVNLRSKLVVLGLLASACTGAASDTSERLAPPPTVSSAPSTQPDTETTIHDLAPNGEDLRAAVPRSVSTRPADGAAPFPMQPEDTPWPTEGWPTGPWPSGVPSDSIDQAISLAMGDGTGARVRAVLVVHQGRLVLESYGGDDGPETVYPSFSLSKSVASAAVGIAVGDGSLSVEDPPDVPAWSGSDDARATITVDDLLRMSSGLNWREQDQSGIDLLALIASEDGAEYVATRPLGDQPGTVFNYSTGTTSLIARVLGDAVGGQDRLREFLDDRLFDVLGIDPVVTRVDDAGTWLAGVSTDMTARSFAKFGLLYLRDGVWDGERILPEGWVDYTRTPSPADPAYGAHWRLDTERPGVLFASGFRGQIITVDPAHDLVVVQLATDRSLSEQLNQAILEAFELG